MIQKIFLLFDGACEPKNPNGNMGLGCAIFYQDKTLIYEHAECIMLGEKGYKETSNNLAEYLALKHGLDYLYDNGYKDYCITCMGDSQLVINQMNRDWKINHGIYSPVALELREMSNAFLDICFQWIPRYKNTYADNLSKREMNKMGIKTKFN